MIARMLIRQNADAPSGAQQFDHRLKSVVAVKQFQARLATCPPHMLVDERVAQSLVDARVSHEPDELRHQLRERLPGSKVTQNEHDRNACSKLACHGLDVFDLHPLENFFR